MLLIYKKTSPQADFSKNPVISFSVLRAKFPLEIFGFQEVFLYSSGFGVKKLRKISGEFR